MRVVVWPADDGGCGRYRCSWPAAALADQGAEVSVQMPDEVSGIAAMFEDVGGVARLRGISRAPDADVVVIQRPLTAARADLVEVLQARGIRVVVEIDDCFETIHPRNASFRATHPRVSPSYNRAHLARACRNADLVTVTTPALARRYGGHGRVAVVPNCVPAWYLDVEPSGGRGLTVGWTGSIDTHPTDLQITRGAVDRALDITLSGRWPTRVPFVVIGTGKGIQKALALREPVLASGWLPIDQYPVHMAEITVGIVPLDDIAFNAAKSALKLMEFAALGVAAVVSPTPDNMRMFGHGCGVIAAKPKDWHRQTRALLTDPDHRADVADRGRAAMGAWTIEGNTHRWWDAWTAALDRKATAA